MEKFIGDNIFDIDKLVMYTSFDNSRRHILQGSEKLYMWEVILECKETEQLDIFILFVQENSRMDIVSYPEKLSVYNMIIAVAAKCT